MTGKERERERKTKKRDRKIMRERKRDIKRDALYNSCKGTWLQVQCRYTVENRI